MRLFFDTNILLDVIEERQDYAYEIGQVFNEVDRGGLEGYLCATSITTMYYLLQKNLCISKAKETLASVLDLFAVAPVNEKILFAASHNNDFKDFEDSVLHESALRIGADAIITRNHKHFSKAKLPVYDPRELYMIKFPSGKPLLEGIVP